MHPVNIKAQKRQEIRSQNEGLKKNDNVLKYIYLSICNFWCMIPKTPQKKNSLELEHRSSANNSFVWSNHSNLQQDTEKSIFKAPIDEPLFKNSQAMINKKLTNGALGKKYAQQDNIFKSKNYPVKQYREVVVSDEFVRSSRLYKKLRQQIQVMEAKHHKQTTEINKFLGEEQNDLKEVKSKNHELKLSLWELRNEIIELKQVLEEEEEENKKLVQEYEYIQQHAGEGEDGEGQFVEDENEEQNVNQGELNESSNDEGEQKEHDFHEDSKSEEEMSIQLIENQEKHQN